MTCAVGDNQFLHYNFNKPSISFTTRWAASFSGESQPFIMYKDWSYLLSKLIQVRYKMQLKLYTVILRTYLN